MKRSGPSGRKAHNPAFTGDLIALGTKSGSSKPSRHTDEPKSGTSLKQGGSGASPLSQPPAKKQKLAKEGAGGLFSDPIRVSQVTQPQPIIAKGGQGSGGKSPYSQQSGPGGSSIGGAGQVIEVHPVELVSTLREARSSGNDTKATRVLAGALKQLRLSRLKPDSTLNAALTLLAKEDSKLFNNPTAIEGLVAVLKREPSAIFKTKNSPSVYTLASQLLLVALEDSYDWPESVAKVYIEDSLGDRLWVDLESCRKLVDNICTIFQTRPYSTGSSSGSSSGSGSGSTGVHTQAPKTGQAGETSTTSGQGGKREGDGGSGAGGEGEQSGELSMEVEVAPRFSPPSIKSLRAYILHLVGEQMGRHGDISRNFLRFLTTAAGLPDIRLKVAQKIEGWIQNPKLGKQCQDLLMTVAVNCHTHSPEDLRVIDALINVRLKTKLFSNQFVACIRELISSHPANLETVLRGVVTNELGQLRSPSNMALIAMMVHTWPEEAAKLLGVVFQEFLTRKEDYLRALRGFLREVIRQVRNEFNFSAFTRSLMQERQETEFTQLDPAHKERMALSLADLITCSCLLTANMLIREAYNGYSKGEKAMVPQLREFFTTLGLIQRDAVWWVHTIVPGTFRPQPVDYKLCLRKCLFLEPAETYHGKDNWPPESDRSLILHMMTEAFLEEDTLMRVLVIGLTRELPLSPADALDIADKLVARAANTHTEDIPRLPAIERKELFNVVFDTTAYRAPPNIQLPEDYQSPALAISKLYWKGWLLLLVLSAFNPKTIGALGWSEYPTLRGMMEMVMTNTYTFPSSMTLVTSDSGSVESKDSAIARELQLSRSEKEAILEYEGHLASSSTSSSSSQGTTITEANSFLLNQVTLLKPKGAARRLPTSVIELVKTVNRSLKLGQFLCRCRSPDFLLDIIKRQGTLESMKWLTELVESSHSSLDVLPTPCLCEFLMASYQEQGSPTYETEADPSSHRAQYKRKKLAKDKAQGRHRQLVTQLRSLLLGPQSSPRSCLEVMEYFFEKLTLSQLTPRSLALKALREILGKVGASRLGGGGKEGGGGELSDDTEDEELLSSGEWLVTILPSLTHFTSILPRICLLLLQACLVETKLQCLQGFILFLTRYSPQEKLYEVSIGISQIIVDRFVVVRKLFQKDSSTEKKTSPSDVDATLSSLLSMLRITMETAIHSQTMPQLSSSDDFLLVSFPTGQKTILHMALIQAVFLLLACNPPTNQSDYTYLLNLWFPVDATTLPEAYTVDDRERVTLPPDAILQYMLYATNTRVLGATIQTAQPEQLCTFVQQFGTPVQSVEKVLERLDCMCESASTENTFVEGVENPVLLSQSVQVQMLRGVKSGKIFLSYLQRHANLPQKPMKALSTLLELSMESTSVAKQPQPSHTKLERREIPRIPQERTEQLLLQIFAPSLSRIGAPPQEVQKLKLDLEQGLKNLVISNLATKVGCIITNAETLNADISGLIAALHKLITSSSIRRQFLEGLVRSSFSITLLRLISRIQKMKRMGGISAGLFKATLQYLLGALESLKSPSSSALVSFQATVKSCAEQLGVKHTSESGDVVLKWSKLVAKTCKEVSEMRSPFESEGALIRTCQSLAQGNVVLVEDIVRAVAKQAVGLGKEAKCIELLDKIRSFSSKNPPIVLQYSPEIFIPNQTEMGDEDGSAEHDKPPEMMDFAEQGSLEGFSTAHTLDLTGLFVDWLQLLDPEVLSLCPESMQQIVFSGNSHQFSTLPTSTPHPSPSLLTSGQGYLLARLTHESTWVTVTKTISALLDSGQLKEWVDPSAVLDFLWACLHNPSLWQGRVKKEAVINSCISMGIDEESQLILTPSQLECLVDCILKEAAAACVGMELTGSSGSEKETEVPPEAKTLLYSRLPLLMCCFNGNQPALKTVIKHLQTHSGYPSLGWQLLVLLYHANERVILLVDHTHPLSTAALSTTAPCKLDTELHDLLSAMADAHPGQESIQRMTNAALLCRKITIRHPALMLRQLPMLGWLLRGRAHLNPGEFRNRNHKQVFINAFVLLDLLQPLVFENSQSDALDACLEPFFDFLKNQCMESKKYQSMVARFSDFLVRYAQHNRDKAAALIYRHLDTLQALSENQQSKKSSLRSLVECFPMKKSKGEEIADESSLHGWGTTMMIVPPLTSSHTLSHEQVMPFLKKLEQGQLREDILKVLQDLEETSLHSVDILKHFVPELCRIIQDKEPTSCKLAHSLLLRHLKQSPSTVDEFLPAFIGCLESHDYNIVMAAVGSIPDLVLLCKAKDAGALLKQLFLLATQFRYNCTSELIRAIEACTQHTFR